MNYSAGSSAPRERIVAALERAARTNIDSLAFEDALPHLEHTLQTLAVGGDRLWLHAPEPDAPKAMELGSPEDEAELTCGDLTLSVAPAGEVEATARARWVDPRLLVTTLLATALVGGTIYLAGHFVPDSKTLPDEEDRPVVYER